MLQLLARRASTSFILEESIMPETLGIILATPAKLLILLMSCVYERKSSKSKNASFIFAVVRSASASDTSAAAFSTRDTTSPMPWMRPAMRSG